MTSSQALVFRTIELPRNADTTVEFRRDSYVCSFGSDDAFGGRETYLGWLADRIARHPAGHVHVWNGDTIIGQIEMHLRPDRPDQGYINLFYLVPSHRGHGLGGALHAYALDFMRVRYARRVTLSVSTTNERALAYYLKHGWRDRGPQHPDRSVHLLELSLSDTGQQQAP
ncbi:MAG: GNAT family N-acetyltransferase [Myxococcales bacterium]|nr:MAG: GNAT family N-acetyltransferase [Myxococcales bacterium]